MHHSTIGGSSDTDENELAVRPTPCPSSSSVVTTVTPVDFHTPEDRLSLSARDLDVAALADAFGNVPGSMLTMGFLMLRPFGLGMGKYLDLAQRMDSGAALEDFLQMERWIFDSPAQPGRMFREFVQQCYQRNALVAGELEQRVVDPGFEGDFGGPGRRTRGIRLPRDGHRDVPQRHRHHPRRDEGEDRVHAVDARLRGLNGSGLTVELYSTPD